MAQFMGDIAFLMELGLVAAGLVLLHLGRERSAALLRAAGWILVVGATATAICTSYFWFHYHGAGDFERAQRAGGAERLSWQAPSDSVLSSISVASEVAGLIGTIAD